MNVQDLLASALGLDDATSEDSDCLAVRFFGDTFPHLNAVLGCTRSDGVDRETSTLTIFEDGGSVSLCLRDRARGRVLYSSGDGFEESLAQLEASLASGKARWRDESRRKR